MARGAHATYETAPHEHSSGPDAFATAVDDTGYTGYNGAGGAAPVGDHYQPFHPADGGGHGPPEAGADEAGDEAAALAADVAEIDRLAAAVHRGEAAATAELLARLAPLVRGAARRAARHARRLGIGAVYGDEDLLQEAYMALLGLIQRYDPAAGPALPYFTVALRARLLRFIRGRARRRPPGRRLAWGQQAAHDLAEVLCARLFRESQALATSGVEAALYEALDRLTPRHKRLLYLHYWRDLSDPEIAAILHTSVAAAAEARYRALAALRRLLDESGMAP